MEDSVRKGGLLLWSEKRNEPNHNGTENQHRRHYQRLERITDISGHCSVLLHSVSSAVVTIRSILARPANSVLDFHPSCNEYDRKRSGHFHWSCQQRGSLPTGL